MEKVEALAQTVFVELTETDVLLVEHAYIRKWYRLSKQDL